MKLYTEEELRKHLYNHSDEFFEKLTPIEIPSDEGVDKRADTEDTYAKYNAFIRGAKWMRNKIQGGNK